MFPVGSARVHVGPCPDCLAPNVSVFGQLAGDVVSYPVGTLTAPPPGMTMTDDIQRFIARWLRVRRSGTCQLPALPLELCDVLNTPRPDPYDPDEAGNAYVFEKSVPLPHGATGRIDLYRRGCFVLEAKQGGESAKAKRYRRKVRRAPAAARKAWPARTRPGTPAMEKARQLHDDLDAAGSMPTAGPRRSRTKRS